MIEDQEHREYWPTQTDLAKAEHYERQQHDYYERLNDFRGEAE